MAATAVNPSVYHVLPQAPQPVRPPQKYMPAPSPSESTTPTVREKLCKQPLGVYRQGCETGQRARQEKETRRVLALPAADPSRRQFDQAKPPSRPGMKTPFVCMCVVSGWE